MFQVERPARGRRYVPALCMRLASEHPNPQCPEGWRGGREAAEAQRHTAKRPRLGESRSRLGDCHRRGNGDIGIILELESCSARADHSRGIEEARPVEVWKQSPVAQATDLVVRIRTGCPSHNRRQGGEFRDSGRRKTGQPVDKDGAERRPILVRVRWWKRSLCPRRAEFVAATRSGGFEPETTIDNPPKGELFDDQDDGDASPPISTMGDGGRSGTFPTLRESNGRLTIGNVVNHAAILPATG